MDLKTPLEKVDRIFAMKKRPLEKLGIITIEDLLFYAPFRYESNLIVSKIGILQLGENVTIQGKVADTTNIYTRRGLSIQKIEVSDDTGKIDAIFYNQKFILSNIKKGYIVSLAGRVDKFGSKKTLIVSSYEVLPEENAPAIHTTGLVPIYSETQNLSSKWIRNRINNLLNQVQIDEFLPTNIVRQNQLISLPAAIKGIHFPKTLSEAEQARKRLSFDELLIKHIVSLVRKKEWEAKQKAIPFQIEKFRTKLDKLIKSLPFELTGAQNRAVEQICQDLEKEIPMNRLLEGDVGSGKTVVAAITIYLAYLNGFQSALMAPTEILANQHFVTISKLLSPLGVKVRLFTSNSKSGKNNEGRIKNNDNKRAHHSSFVIHHSDKFDVAIGTHSLIHAQVKFEKLGLVVIDEQQRFGVEQRATLRKKGKNPHFLTMTATPIPRTIFLTIYADLALSHLDEMPQGRQKIKTWVVPEEKREKGYKWIEDKIRTENSQVFIVCPFIEPSETLNTVRAAKEEFDRLKNGVFSEFRMGLLHGKMKATEKAKAIKEFKEGDVNILVATPVIEVGIDIPTADIMIIEAAERFGLAELHHLRGRIGRGAKQSYCLLFTESISDRTRERLGYLEHIDDGAKLAEKDLKLRGPGEMFGTTQHGIPDLKIASFSDFSLIERSRKEAEKIFKELPKYPEFKRKVDEVKMPQIAPD